MRIDKQFLLLQCINAKLLMNIEYLVSLQNFEKFTQFVQVQGVNQLLTFSITLL